MKNRVKFVGMVVGVVVLVAGGFGLGRWSMEGRVKELENRVAVLEGSAGEAGRNGCFVESLEPIGQTRTATVTYVIDGDTIEVDGEERVRYLGINTPESGRPYFTEATNENKRLVEGKEVKLELDVQTKDQYGRTLAYVWVGKIMVNLGLVYRGYANVYTIPPNVKYEALLLKAEKDAQEDCRGFWALGAVAQTNKIEIVNINADAPGDDNENKNGEWVEIQNQGENSVNMTNWTLKDEANHIYTFADFTLAPDKSVLIYSGCDIDTQEKLYWQCPDGEYAIWNNTGDTAFLRDASGNLVDSYKY